MPRKQKKYHFIYKTTNLVNGNYYVGMHSTDDLEDGYIGSGKRLWYSIKKHGREHHKLEILEFLDNRVSLANREREIVNEEFLKDPQCMNLQTGGEGFSVESAIKGGKSGGRKTGAANFASGARKMHDKLQTDIEFRKFYSQRLSDGLTDSRHKHDAWGFTGKNHSDETRAKMSNSQQGKQIGEKNSQFGTCWVCKENETLKIPATDLDVYLSDGWFRGRKIKTKVVSLENN